MVQILATRYITVLHAAFRIVHVDVVTRQVRCPRVILLSEGQYLGRLQLLLLKRLVGHVPSASCICLRSGDLSLDLLQLPLLLLLLFDYRLEMRRVF